MKERIATMSREALANRRETLQTLYDRMKAKGLDLDLSRGKPSTEQLDMVSELMREYPLMSYLDEAGHDCRNYGVPEGIPEARRLMARLAETTADKVIVHGESSLELMYQTFLWAKTFPLPGQDRPWGQEGFKILCPVPGYDRHFAMAEALGAELIPVPQTAGGPDMEVVTRLVADDPSVKGLWLVPKYSNPSGVTAHAETLQQLAEMEAPEDFLIFYDNAYSHHAVLDDEAPHLPDMLRLCEVAGHPMRAVVFASLSKITYASGGMAAIAMNEPLRSWWMKHQSVRSIGSNKVNQLRHTRMIEDAGGLDAVMRRHQALLAPRFRLVLDILALRLDGTGILEVEGGDGGYFISVYLPEGTARRTAELCREAGVTLTTPGSTYPYGKDPEDRHLRLAPSYPPMDALRPAMEVFCLSAELAAVERALTTYDRERTDAANAAEQKEGED